MRSLSSIIATILSIAAVFAISLTGCGGIECGQGTIEVDGECVLADGAGHLECGSNTTEENGQCVADSPADCDDGELLDPNENRCFPADEVCGENTAYSADEDRCIPTEDVCTTGTSYDETSGLCFPGTECKPGDVVLDGVCVSWAEFLADDVDVIADGNTHPAFGGTPIQLTVPPVGEQTVFAGTIDGPSDLDGDGQLNQHIDFFAFEAEAGDWFEISLYANGMPNPAFVIGAFNEANDFERLSPVLVTQDKMRQIAVPEDGNYFIAVLPETLFFADPGFLVGDDDWGYVGTLSTLALPQASTHDFDAQNYSATLGDLTSNYIKVENFEANSQVSLTRELAAQGADEVATVWASPTEQIAEFIGESTTFQVPESGEFYILFDWFTYWSNRELDFEISASEAVTFSPGQVETYDFNAELGDILEIWQANDGGGSVTVTITDESDDEMFVEELFSTYTARYVGLRQGEYTVTVSNDGSEDLIGFEHDVGLVSPELITDHGTIQTGTASENMRINQDFYLVEFSESGFFNLEATHLAGTGWMRLFVYELDNRELAVTDESPDFVSSTVRVESDTPYIIRIGNTWPNLDGEFDYELRFQEQETTLLDESTVTATAGDILEIRQTNDEFADVRLTIADSAGAQLVDRDLASGELFRYIGLDDEVYTVTFTGYTDDTVDGFAEEVSHISPQPITDFDADHTGMSNQHDAHEQSFYLVERSELTSYEITLTHVGGQGQGRLFVYELGDELLASTTSVTDATAVTSLTHTFEADTPYVLRVGNELAFGDPLEFDYELSFQVQ